MNAAVLWLAACAANAQTVSSAPAVSTDTAVAVSTAPVEPKYIELPEEAKPTLTRPIRVKIHKEAKDWEPLALKNGVDPLSTTTAFERLITGKKGQRSRAKAYARVYDAGEDKLLVISVFPDALVKYRTHVEIRMKLIEGYLEEAKVAAVTAQDAAGAGLDSRKLKLVGVAYQEEFPEDAVLTISAVDPAPGKSAVNAGRLKAQFGNEELGLVSLAFGIKGVNLKDPGASAAKAGGELPGCPDDARRADVPVLRARAEEAAEAGDYDEAYLSACRAARVGDAASQHMTATIFQFGYGRARPRDMKLANVWYTRAAAQNYGPAAGALAVLYRKVQPERSQQYLRQAARLGHAPSQAGLGAAYRSGRGEERDLIEAYRWYWLAYKGGQAGAERALDELAADLSPMQMDEARRRATMLLPKP